ncbi:hypothetical protein HYQ44_005703 [Verticillium longisporum]|nr:hypothetical protein HYQ44_005703 [Verticillium longisporum]
MCTLELLFSAEHHSHCSAVFRRPCLTLSSRLSLNRLSSILRKQCTEIHRRQTEETRCLLSRPSKSYGFENNRLKQQRAAPFATDGFQFPWHVDTGLLSQSDLSIDHRPNGVEPGLH